VGQVGTVLSLSLPRAAWSLCAACAHGLADSLTQWGALLGTSTRPPAPSRTHSRTGPRATSAAVRPAEQAPSLPHAHACTWGGQAKAEGPPLCDQSDCPCGRAAAQVRAAVQRQRRLGGRAGRQRALPDAAADRVLRLGQARGRGERHGARPGPSGPAQEGVASSGARLPGPGGGGRGRRARRAPLAMRGQMQQAPAWAAGSAWQGLGALTGRALPCKGRAPLFDRQLMGCRAPVALACSMQAGLQAACAARAAGGLARPVGPAGRGGRVRPLCRAGQRCLRRAALLAAGGRGVAGIALLPRAAESAR